MELSTTYMGIPLKHPLVASASPITRKLEGFKKLEDGGASAIVMHSLFEEQVIQESAALDYFVERGSESFGEALSFFPDTARDHSEADRHLELLSKAVASIDVPVIGSLNGSTLAGWPEYARKFEQAGAAGLELNIYHIPADAGETGADVEQLHVDVLCAVKQAVKIPVAMKLSPFFSSMSNMAVMLDKAGADALVMFNRFYQPDFDLESMTVEPSLQLSSSYEIRLPLMWIALLYGRLRCSLAATRGVHSGLDMVKYLLAGADAVMTTSALLHEGPQRLKSILDEGLRWMEKKEYASVEQLKGSMSQKGVADPTAFRRANYIRTIESFASRYAAS